MRSEWSIVEARVVSEGPRRGGNPRTWWWTPEVRNVIRLKKESYRAWLARRTPEATTTSRLSAGAEELLANRLASLLCTEFLGADGSSWLERPQDSITAVCR